MSNEAWARALEEAESPEARDKGLWAKCFVEAGGDEGRAKAAYVTAKVGGKVVPAPAAVPDIVFVCPACGEDCPRLVETCPHCKAVFSENGWKPFPKGANKPLPTSPAAASAAKSGSWRWLKWLIGVPVAGFVILVILGKMTDSPERRARMNDADTIDYCWEEQKRPSLDPSTARVAAQACERMESDFRARWGRAP